jgi:hypothetical protein
MSLLKILKDAPRDGDLDVPGRWVTALDAADSIGEPKAEFFIYPMDGDEWDRMRRPYAGSTGISALVQLSSLSTKDKEQLVKKLFRRILCNLREGEKEADMRPTPGWRGITRGNLARMSTRALRNPEKLKTLPDVIVFSFDTAMELACILNNEFLTLLASHATDVDTFAVEVREGNANAGIEDETSSSN